MRDKIYDCTKCVHYDKLPQRVEATETEAAKSARCLAYKLWMIGHTVMNCGNYKASPTTSEAVDLFA